MSEHKFICFATITAAAIFEVEIKGQLSDGAWENAQPMNHWIPWTDAHVSVDKENPGRNFRVQKDGYRLTTLLKIEGIKRRMIIYGRLAAFGYTPEQVEVIDTAFLDMYGDWVGLKQYDGPFWDKLRDRVQSMNQAFIQRAMADESLYSEKDLREDLKVIRQAMKTRTEWDEMPADVTGLATLQPGGELVSEVEEQWAVLYAGVSA